MTVKCSRCLLTDDVPGVQIPAEGLCSVCLESDKVWAEWESSKDDLRQQLDKIVDRAKRKNRPYDALVPLSGGKDSTYVLYLCRKRYGLNCLAVTFDNGFLSDDARLNIRNAVDKLGVDHMFYGLSSQTLMKLYRLFFLKSGFFCSVCMRGISATIERAAAAFSIPLVITGTSLRTEEHVAPEFFEPGELSFFKEVIDGEPLEKEAKVLLSGDGVFESVGRVLSRHLINLPDFIDWDYDEIFRTITEELGWKAHRDDAEHADCKVENIVNYIRFKKFPVLIPEMPRFSKLVTIGQMSREEALEKVSGNESTSEPENLDWFLDQLEIDRSDMERILGDPLMHMKYFKEDGGVLRSLRRVKKAVFDPVMGRS